MQGTLNQTKSSSDSIMPFSKDSSSNDENSGLHDLQAMASSAKRRRSKRLSTQMEAQDSLLRSTAALDAVVLPDPNKEQAAVSIDSLMPAATGSVSTPATSASTSASSSSATAAPDLDGTTVSKGSGKGLYIGLAIAAAAAAGAFLVLGDSGSSDSASTPVAGIVHAADPVPGDAGSDEVAPSAVTRSAVTPSAVTPSELTAVSATATAPETSAPEATPTGAAATEPAAKPDLVAKVSKSAKTERASKSKGETKTKPGPSSTRKNSEAKTKPTAAKVVKTSGASASLDDVLSTVTGGVDKPIAQKSEAGPSKTSLGRGDVSKAMKKITPAAKGCYKAEEFSGMVKIKYSVSPDGKVTKASATGAHASSKTGACVVKAVRKAKFPPFSGATMSFSFPFLLSP